MLVRHRRHERMRAGAWWKALAAYSACSLGGAYSRCFNVRSSAGACISAMYALACVCVRVLRTHTGPGMAWRVSASARERRAHASRASEPHVWV